MGRWVDEGSAGGRAAGALDPDIVVDGGRARHLEERACALGFEDLRGYPQARCDAGASVPRLAVELGLSD